MHAGSELMSGMRFPQRPVGQTPSTGGPERGKTPSHRVRDAGSALPLVLALMVIGALIVIPMLRYTVSVMKHNTALSEKTQRVEAVRAGLRVALADPISLYETCRVAGENTQVTLASPPGFDVTTKCYSIGFATARDEDELRQGAVTTRVGQAPPAMLQGLPSPVPTRTAPADWLADVTPKSETGKVWLPNLPVHGLNLRSPVGTQMAAGFATCTVYFPGTYPDPVVIGGPTFFTSGVYYFENEVRVQGGASVVVGGGATPGCTTDQEAVFYAQNVPGTHNMSGLGATWVLGGNGRVVVTNDAAVSMQFNKRYVEETDLGGLPAADVSIMTVNGGLGGDGVTGTPFAAAGLQVPLSLVGSDGHPATDQGYLPSLLTPNWTPGGVPSTAPVAPARPTVIAGPGVARISWAAPATGAVSVTSYTVTASPGATTCTFTLATVGPSGPACDIDALDPTLTYTFTVVASNIVGDSPASQASTPVTAAVTNPPLDALPAPVVPEFFPVIALELSGPGAATVEIPGYVSAPQGRIAIDNPGGQPIGIRGGILAAEIAVVDGRPAPIPVGFEKLEVQHKLRIVSTTSAGPETSTAIVQVNQNGGNAVNSWEVQ